MSLSLRFLIMLVAFGAVIVVGVLMVDQGRDAHLHRQRAEAVARDLRIVWDEILQRLQQRMLEEASVLRQNEGLALAMSQARRDRVRRLMAPLADRIVASSVVDRVDIYDPAGRLWFTSVPTPEPTTMVRQDVVAETADAPAVSVAGIGNDAQGHVMVVVLFPLRLGMRTVAVAGYAVPIAAALEDLGSTTDTKVFLVNRRGRLLEGEPRDLWNELQSGGGPDLASGFAIRRLGRRVFGVSRLPWTADLGTLSANLIVVRDVTEASSAPHGIHHVAALFAVVLAGLGFGAWFVRRETGPLVEAVQRLTAALNGESTGPLPDVVRCREVTDINEAAVQVRRLAKAQQRATILRDHLGIRSRRFLRAQIAALVPQLDGDLRDQVLSDLEAMEAGWGDGAAGGREGTGLLMMAVERLATLLRDEHERRLAAEAQSAAVPGGDPV